MAQPQKNTLKSGFHHLRTVYRKGDIIFHEDDMRDNAYIIEKGEVEISTTRQGRKVPLVRLGQGEVFGETALMGAGKRTATAIATEDSEVFMISPSLLRDRIMHLDPLVGLLMSLLVNRYRRWRYRAPEEAEEEASALPRTEENLSLVTKADEFMRDLNERKEIALNELRMAEEITQAVEQKQFVPFLQPIVSLPEQKLMGFEALIRWQHPQRGLVSPAEFVPIAERTQVVWELDMLMLKKACELAPQLQKEAGNPAQKIYVSVNLSGSHFDSVGLSEQISNIIKSSGIDPKHLVFEITESALMGDPLMAEKILHNLKETGARIALDDFGTGYSSLGYLHRFPIDIIKIDRSFVRDMQTNRKSLDIVRAIVTLAKTFGLQIVGEGIESEKEIIALSGIGCDYGQGYFFSKPLPAEEALAYLRTNV